MGLLFNALLTITVTLSFSVLAHTRSLPNETPKTTSLDVSSALARTRSVFSIAPKTRSERSGNENDAVSARLELHSRVSVHGVGNYSYRSVVLSRLERDSARAESLLGRVGRVGLARSERLVGPVVSGTSQGSGEYFSRVSIGRPPSPAYMVVDTGSDVSWVQCAPCADCYTQADPIFEPAASSTYSPLSCGARRCRSLDVSECRNDTCLYEVSYGDGSYTVGEFVTETITVGSTQVQDIAIGCGHNNEGLFVGAAGLLGLGGGSLSFPSQLNATSFSYCLVDRDSDSASTLEFGSALPVNAVTAPLIRNPEADTFYYLDLAGVSVGGEELPISDSSFRLDQSGNGGIIIDSGTAVTRLQTDVYNSLRDAFLRGTRHLVLTAGMALFDTCYDLSSRSSVEVPTVSFRFGGGGGGGNELSLPASNYLIPVDSEGTFCFAFAPTASGLSIVGNVQQQGIRVGFDLRNGLVGFSPSDC